MRALVPAMLIAGIAIGLLLPRPTASRTPTARPAPAAAMRDVAAAINLEDTDASPAPLVAASHQPDPSPAQGMGPEALTLRVQPDPVPVAVPKATQRPGNGLHGQASWFGAPTGTAAAGRPLRAFLGRGWRHDRVRVCGPAGCTRVVLDDWMGHPTRAIDLSAWDFRGVCGPLWLGVCRVRITRA